MKIKVGTYNIWWAKDFSVEGHPVNIGNIASFIYEKGIAVCGLNEVDVNCNRTGNLHEPEEIVKELEKLSGQKYYWAMAVGLDGYHNEGAKYGNALISKYPIVKTEDIKIFGPYVADPEKPKTQIQNKRERRALLVAELDVDGKPLTAMVTHFDLYEDTVRCAVDTVKAKLADVHHSAILTGDFNVLEDDDFIVELDEVLTRTGKDDPTATFHSGPKIDYIYHTADVSSEGYCVHQDVKSSDHFPVSVTIEF